MESGDGAHEVIIHPEPTHRVVKRGIDAHRALVGALPGDVLVHLEEVAVALPDGLLAESLDGIGKVEVDAEPARTHTTALVADLLGTTGSNVAGSEIAIAGILTLEVVVTLLLGNIPRGAGIAFLFRNPDASVIPERLGHKGELGLVIAGNRDAGGVNLGVAGICKGGSTLVGAPCGGDIGAAGVG